MKNQPIETVTWVERRLLRPNDYNPNFVAPPELKLLKISILETGWTQPIVTDLDYVIIDGFHRYTVAADPEVARLTNGMVPVVVVKGIDSVHRRLATIRHNRARGSHAVVEMSRIIRHLVEKENMSMAQIMERLQMEDEEVYRLATKNGMPTEVFGKQGEFGDSWIPKEE